MIFTLGTRSMSKMLFKVLLHKISVSICQGCSLTEREIILKLENLDQLDLQKSLLQNFDSF